MKKKPLYRLEYAKSIRSACTGRLPCTGTKISEGELRFGTFVVYGNTGAEGYRWRHWGCVTSRQLDNMHGSSLYKVPADISGFDQLRPEDQLRVEDAFYAREVNAADIPATALAGKKTLAAQRDDAIYHPVPATPPSMGIGSVPSTPQSPEKPRVPATPAYKARGKKNRREVDEDDLGSNVHRSFGVAEESCRKSSRLAARNAKVKLVEADLSEAEDEDAKPFKKAKVSSSDEEFESEAETQA